MCSKNECKVSIIVPVYNVEQYLSNCINSILKQTYSKFELILINDGSKDKSGEICENYAKEDSRIKVIHQSNKGQSSARNVGIKVSKGEWILFIDSDDIVHHQMLEFLIRAVQDSGANMSVCGRLQESIIPQDFFRVRNYQYKYVNINEDIMYQWYKSKDKYDSNIYWLIYPKLIRKDIVEKNYFCEGRIFEDNEVSCKWLYEAKNIAIIPQDMYFYTINPTGTMQSKFSSKKLDYLWALEQQAVFFESINYNKMCKTIIQDYFPTVIWMCKCVKKELNDTRLIQKVMLHAEYLYKKWNKKEEVEIESSWFNHIYKYAHPIKYKVRRRLKEWM